MANHYHQKDFNLLMLEIEKSGIPLAEMNYPNAYQEPVKFFNNRTTLYYAFSHKKIPSVYFVFTIPVIHPPAQTPFIEFKAKPQIEEDFLESILYDGGRKTVKTFKGLSEQFARWIKEVKKEITAINTYNWKYNKHPEYNAVNANKNSALPRQSYRLASSRVVYSSLSFSLICIISLLVMSLSN